MSVTPLAALMKVVCSAVVAGALVLALTKPASDSDLLAWHSQSDAEAVQVRR